MHWCTVLLRPCPHALHYLTQCVHTILMFVCQWLYVCASFCSLSYKSCLVPIRNVGATPMCFEYTPISYNIGFLACSILSFHSAAHTLSESFSFLSSLLYCSFILFSRFQFLIFFYHYSMSKLREVSSVVHQILLAERLTNGASCYIHVSCKCFNSYTLWQWTLLERLLQPWYSFSDYQNTHGFDSYFDFGKIFLDYAKYV